MTEHTESPSGLIERVVEMESAVGQAHWSDAAAFFTPDCVYKVVDLPELRGVEGVRHYMEWQNSIVEWLGHEPRMAIQHGTTVIIEVTSRFRRLSDETVIEVPCTDIYRFDGTRIFDWRVYANISLFKGGDFMIGGPDVQPVRQ